MHGMSALPSAAMHSLLDTHDLQLCPLLVAGSIQESPMPCCSHKVLWAGGSQLSGIWDTGQGVCTLIGA